jgi:tetratricopeptide (TPR) repeat protein
MVDERRESRFERGLILLENGHLEEARQYLIASLELEGYTEECSAALAEMYDQFYPDANERGEYDFEDDESDTEAGKEAIQEGIHHLELGHFGRAIGKLRQAVKLAPETAAGPLITALCLKAVQYIERSLFDKAILLYNECLTLKRDDADVYNSRAWAKLGAGLLVEAETDFSIATRLKEQEPQAGSCATKTRQDRFSIAMPLH